MSSRLDLPPPDLPAPNAISWPADKPIYRVHHSEFGANEFNPGAGSGRFHPIQTASGRAIPTIYASNTIDGALSETVFHNVPVRGPTKRIACFALLPLMLSTLAATRDLRLIELKGHGLRKLGVLRSQLIDTDSDQYDVTRRWAETLFELDSAADGLIWMSRQHDASEAILLFGNRIARSALRVIEAPRPLHPPNAGWLEVLRAADNADITIDFA